MAEPNITDFLPGYLTPEQHVKAHNAKDLLTIVLFSITTLRLTKVEEVVIMLEGMLESAVDSLALPVQEKTDD